MKRILFFSASWCAQCPPAKAALKDGMRAAGLPTSTLTSILTVYDMDEPESGPIANKYEVKSLPAVVLLEDGEPVDKMIGSGPDRDAIYWEARLKHWMECDQK